MVIWDNFSENSAMIFEPIPDYVLALVGYLLLYFFIHSLLASLGCKQWFGQRWPASSHHYRLCFNALALIMLLPIAWMGSLYGQAPLWQWSGSVAWIADGLALTAVVGFIHSLQDYDLGLFTGVKQWRNRSLRVDAAERFKIGVWHRFVRHPWYFFLLVILWTREMDLFQLTLYLMISIYLIIGSRLEDAKLVAYYGPCYQRYLRLVPGLFPIPWRCLSPEQAVDLLAEQNPET